MSYYSPRARFWGVIRSRHLSPLSGSPAACIKPVCSAAAAELDVSEWGPKIIRSLPGGISTLSCWWLASKKYWRQRWRGNLGSTAWSGQDPSFMVFSTHLGRGNLRLQSWVQGLLKYFIQCLFYLKYVKSCRLLHHQAPHWPKPLQLIFCEAEKLPKKELKSILFILPPFPSPQDHT